MEDDVKRLEDVEQDVDLEVRNLIFLELIFLFSLLFLVYQLVYAKN